MYLNLDTVAPDSTHEFRDNKEHLLVFIRTYQNCTTFVTKIKIREIGNVSKLVQGFRLEQSVLCLKPSMFNVKLFERDPKSRQTFLLFSGAFDLNTVNITPPTTNITFTLRRPSNTLNVPRYGICVNDTDLLQEQFFSYQTVMAVTNCPETCTVSLTYDLTPKYRQHSLTQIKPDLQDTLYVYHRYRNTIVKELMPYSVTSTHSGGSVVQINDHHRSFVNKFCSPDASYFEFIKAYQRDDNIYTPPPHTSDFRLKLNRRIKPEHRKQFRQPDSDTMMTAPVDGRARGFKINPTLRMTFYNHTYELSDITDKPKKFINGSGFAFRVSPQDNQRVHLPFGANLKQIVYYDDDTVSLRFRSSYFMPDAATSRDLEAVVYGNYTHTSTGGRNYPELMQTQDDTTLEYLITVITPEDNQFEFTNVNLKLTSADQDLKTVWMEQGTEIGKINCGCAYVVVMCNRPIDFSDDIKHNSKIVPNRLHKPLDTYVRLKDHVGVVL